jgi:hypothetical protein
MQWECERQGEKSGVIPVEGSDAVDLLTIDRL